MGIFKLVNDDFTTYRATLQFRSRIMAGTPKDPAMIATWLKLKTGITNDDIIRDMVRRTIEETSGLKAADATLQDVSQATEQVMIDRSLNVFKRDPNGLFLESRCLKAGLREAVAVAFGGERWVQDPEGSGAKRPPKSANNMFRERVFINPDKLYLGRQKADDILLFTGHVMTPQGQRSNVGFIEWVEEPQFVFDVAVFKNTIPLRAWPTIWNLLEEIGLGSMRSQGFGRFDIVQWDEVEKGQEFTHSTVINAALAAELMAEAEADAGVAVSVHFGPAR